MKISRTQLSKNIGYLKTAVKFREDIIEYAGLATQTGNAYKQMSTIQKSIPKKYADTFLDLAYNPKVMNNPLIIKLSEMKDKARRIYDIVIDKPLAKIHSACYFTGQEIKRGINTLFSKKPQITVEDVQRIVPSYYKIPENLTNENAKEFLTKVLKDAQFSNKEIELLLCKKQPVFYRFVGERELRSLKQGHNVQSAAWYNEDMNRTDITSNSKYNINKYRVTFKYNPCWNPFSKNSKVQANDLDLRKWWLFGPYSKKDIVCTERVFY